MTPDETGYICTISTAALNKNGNRIERCAVDYTGETLLFSDALGNVFVAHIYKNRFLAIATNSRAYCLQFLDHNKLMFAIATYDRNVKVVNSSGKLEETLKGHTKKVTRIEVNYTKQLFFTMSKDCIDLWNLKNFRRVRSLYPKKDGFIDAVFSKDGDHLISRFEVRDCLTKNGLLYYWNLVTYEMEREVHSHSDRENMAVLSDEKQIIFAYD